VEIEEAVNTGFAIANPNDSAASVSFFFTDENGKDSKPGMLTLPPHGQIARFLSESPFHAPNANGTFTFSSEIPVSAVAIRGLTNERSEFLATTLPIANPDQPAEAALHFPQVADGGGWTTQFTLVNPTDETITGNVSYAGQQGTAGSSLAYSIPPRSSRRLTTAGTGAVTLIGAAQIRPDASSTAPVGLALYSYKQGSVTVSQAGVPSVATGKAFRQFVESPADGLVRTGFAIKNISGNATNVTLDLYKLDGSYAGFSGSLPLAGSQQRSLFLDEIEGFAEMPRPFKGFLRIRSGSGTDLAVFGLRGRTNERGEFLIAATPPVDESAPAVGKMTFPHLVNGEGYGTQFVLYGNGTLKLHDQSGASLNLNMQ
jgi:hypothetical protein